MVFRRIVEMAAPMDSQAYLVKEERLEMDIDYNPIANVEIKRDGSIRL
jgi:hypothetical protein